MTYEELIQKLEDNGYENVVIFKDYDYASAFIGVTDDNRAVYSYEKMIDYLMNLEGWDYDTAVEWVDFNVLSIQSHTGELPIVMYSLN